jgi:hypothetical protein
MRRFTFFLTLTATALVTSLAAHRAGAQTTTPKVLWACYVPGSGTTYRVRETDLKQTCIKDTHVMFSWNETGPPGPQGPAGPQGPQGATGATGAQGPAGGIDWSQLWTGTASFIVRQGTTNGGVITCPAGKKMLNGGWNYNGTTGGASAYAKLHLVMARFDHVANKYLVTLYNDGSDQAVDMSAACI